MRYFLLFIFVLLSTSPANASSPVGYVGGATVNAGESSAEFRIGYTKDDSNAPSADRRLRMRQHADYAFNDWYALRLVVAQDKRRNDAMEHQAVVIENRFQLFEKRIHGWDAGFRLVYTQSDGDKTPHEAEIRLLGTLPLGEYWAITHNTIIEHDIGNNADDGLLMEFRHMLARKVPSPFSYITSLTAGMEMFNQLGRLNDLSGYQTQSHQLGPVLKGTLEDGYYFETGYRAGISRMGADHLFKFSVGKKF